MKRLEGKVAIVTGAGSGIGRATALLFAREGAKVVAVCRTARNGEETVRMIREAGGEAIYVKADVSQGEDVGRMIEKTVDTYGRLDILSNNAGVLRDEGLVADCKEEVFDTIMAVNFKSVWLCMKHAIPKMLEAGGGVIVNNASIAAFLGLPGLGTYAASKGAIISLSKVAAVEYADKNIRVNCVLPGHVGTTIFYSLCNAATVDHIKATTFQRRVGEPEEVAQAILFLASNESSWTTGASLPTDGGVSALLP